MACKHFVPIVRNAIPSLNSRIASTGEADHAESCLQALDPNGTEHAAWLARGGRFVNRHADTNTLAVVDDTQAVSLFLRERASRSRHTLRAYVAELRKIIGWCDARQIGSLSDLTRNNLLSYRDTLRSARTSVSDDGQQSTPALGERSTARAQAVVASLYRHWSETGYLTANPAAGLVTGAQPRATFAPQRFIPAALLARCDAWVEDAMAGKQVEPDILQARRGAIWALYRYAGVRLVELAWSINSGLPRIQAESAGCWTLYVNGKGNKPHKPRAYRLAHGLPAEPAEHECVPLIHGFKGGSLQEAGLYREVKGIFEAVADSLDASNPARILLLRAASPH